VSGVEEAERFLGALFAGLPGDEGLFSYGWTLKDKVSHWFPTADGHGPMAERLVSLSDDSDVYVGASLAHEPLGPKSRVRNESSAGIFGLWADIDIQDPDVHKKFTLPPSEEAAFELLDSTGVRPSIVVNSGHGLQAWWLLKEAWLFDDEDERRHAAAFSEQWNTTLRVKAAEHGWVVDSTFDLSRVMRLPGTRNLKGEPVPVLLHSLEEIRYDVDEIEEFFVSEERLKELGIKATRTYVVGDLTLDPDAQPPSDKLLASFEIDDRLRLTWQEDRKDLDKVDGSPSQYDLSMISQLVSAGWSDQEIVDTCIARRRNRGHDLKLRPDYWKRSLAKARSTHATEWSEEQLEEQVDLLNEAREEGDDELVRERRREVLDSLSAMLGHDVTGFVKYVGDPPSFELKTPAGSISFPSALQLNTQNQFSAQFWAITGFRPSAMKPQKWHAIINHLGSIWEEQDIGDDATEAGLMVRHLENYLDTCVPDTSLDQAIAQGYPYVSPEGDVYIFPNALRQHIYVSHGDRLSPRDVGRLLSKLGYVSEKVNATIGGKRTSRSAWKLGKIE
jgi:hypothetical protein